MKIEFTTPEITEFTTGNFYVKNTGKPFDIPMGSETDFLSHQHPIDGNLVNVFKPATVDGNVVVVENEAETIESLQKMSREELEALAKESGLDGDSYTNKKELATAIMAVKGA